MRGRFAQAATLLAAVGLSACTGWGSKNETAGGGTVSGSASAGTAAAGGPPAGGGAPADGMVPWVDPEPPGAQALAEQVVSAPWNQDKKTQLEGRTTQLTMSITVLVGNKSNLQGFQTAVAPDKSTLDERLSRLGAEVTGTEVTIRLPGSVLFDFDSAQIRPDAERTLAEVADVVKGYAKRPVRVEGHTDSIASDDYNQKLSERRAAAVREWFVAKGIEGPRLATRGWGKSKPVADNATPEGRQKNRRVEVIIEKGR